MQGKGVSYDWRSRENTHITEVGHGKILNTYLLEVVKVLLR